MSGLLEKEDTAMVPLDQKLRSEAQWRIWIGHIKSAADSEGVWTYLDPDKPDSEILALPQEVEEPEATNRHGDVVDPLDLTDVEWKRWKMQIELYDRQETKRLRLRKIMTRLNSLITRSLATEHHFLIVDEVTPREKLVKLAQSFKPKPENRMQELRRAWRAMIKQPTSQTNIDQWLTQWETLYEEAKVAKIPDCASGAEYAIRDFLDAVQPIDDAFCMAWRRDLRTRDATFHEVITDYRSRRSELGVASTRKRSQPAAFATLSGEKEAKPGERTYRKRCPCARAPHDYARCYYLNPSIRPEGWKPKDEIVRLVEENIKQMSPADQEKIANLQKRDQSAQFAAGETSTTRLSLFASNMDIVASVENLAAHPLQRSWIVDCGSNTHICNDRERYINFTPADSTVKAGDTTVRISGSGTVKINGQDPIGRMLPITLEDVKYSPGFHTNLIAHSKLEEKGYWVDFSRDALVSKASNEPVAKVQRRHGLYTMEYRPLQESAFSTKISEKPLESAGSAERWHRRLGHAYAQKIEKLPDLVDGVKIEGAVKDTSRDNPERCETCEMTKSKRQISRRGNGTSYGRFGRIHFDLVQIDPGYNGERWMTHFYVEGIRLHVVFTHEKKNGCQDAVREFVALAKTQWNLPLRAFRYDNERSAGRNVENFLVEAGFVIEHSVVGTPEQNSFAERSGGVVLAIARALLLDAGLPSNLWPEAVRAAAYILNRSPTKLGDGSWIIPYQQAQGVRINLANLRLYGCRAYVRRQDIPNASKMEPRAEIGYLVGYQASNIWKVWFPRRNIVRAVRDVVFDENRLFDSGEIQQHAPGRDILESMPWAIEQDDEDEMIQQINHQLDLAIEEESQTQEAAQQEAKESATVKTAPQGTQQMISPSATPSLGPETRSESPPGAFPISPAQEPITEQLQGELSATAPARSAPRDIVGDISDRNIATGSRSRQRKAVNFMAYEVDSEDEEGVLGAFAAGLNGSREHSRVHRDELPLPPRNWKEMLNHPFNEGFLAACGLEIKTLERKDTFEVIQRPNDRSQQVLPLMWVFSYKFDSNGYLGKLKARICVRGDLQALSAEEKYAATLAARTARAVFALVAAFDLDTYQFDAVNAFLNSSLDELVITEMPEGFGRRGYCWKLLRALYGLRKSPRLWQREASKVLTTLGLQVVQEDLCLFAADGIIALFYVDDIIVVNHPSKRERAAEIRRRMNEQWELRDMGEATWFLGIRILRDRKQKAIWLCQDSYISSMASRYHLTDRRRVDIPLPTASLSKFAGQATREQIHEYQRKVGSAQYATTISRPDAAKATAMLAQFLSNPGPEHLEAINRVIGYLYYTRFRSICYRPRSSETAEAVSFFSDASFADNQDRKSSEGYICMIFGGPVDWRSGKQRTVTTSTTEAELLAISEAARMVDMWRRLFAAIHFDPEHPLALNCDNQQTIGLLVKEQPQLRTRLRHVDIHHHWLRQEVQVD